MITGRINQVTSIEELVSFSVENQQVGRVYLDASMNEAEVGYFEA